MHCATNAEGRQPTHWQWFAVVLLLPAFSIRAQQHELLNLPVQTVERFVDRLSNDVAAEADSSTSPLTIRAVAIVDPRSGEISEPSDVVIANGRIVRVGPARPEVPSATEVLDGEGRYLLPGLVDSHVHLAPFMLRLLPLFVRSGVTSIINLSGSEGHLALAREIGQRSLPLPALYSSGPFLQQAAGLDGKAACRIAEQQAEQGYVALKFYQEDMHEADFRQLLRCSAELRLPLFGHLIDDSGVEWLSASGMVIAHAEELLDTRWRGQSDWMADSQLRLSAAQLLATSDVILIPNLSLYRGFIEMLDDAKYAQMLALPEMALMPSVISNLYGESNPYRLESAEGRASAAARMRARLRQLEQFTRDFAEAGGRLLVGTDAPNPMAVYGVSMHLELAALRDAGLSTRRILEAATWTPWLVLKQPGRGVVAPGAVADLLLLEGNPLTDLRTLQHPVTVVLRGKAHSAKKQSHLLSKLHSEESIEAE